MAHSTEMKSTRIRNRGRFVVVAAFVVVGALLAWRAGAFELLTIGNIDRLGAWFDELGWWAPAAFILLWVAASVFFLPGLVLTIMGGLIFGAAWGTLWTTIGANLGAVAAFLIGRYAARGMVEAMMERNAALRRIDEGVRRHGWRMLMITRLVPVFPFNVQNYVYGLTGISLRTYILVTLPCMVPATLAYNLAAGSIRTGDLGRSIWYLAVAAVFFVVLSLLPGWVRRHGPSAGVDGPG